jgi:hypothetical protein
VEAVVDLGGHDLAQAVDVLAQGGGLLRRVEAAGDDVALLAEGADGVGRRLDSGRAGDRHASTVSGGTPRVHGHR